MRDAPKGNTASSGHHSLATSNSLQPLGALHLASPLESTAHTRRSLPAARSRRQTLAGSTGAHWRARGRDYVNSDRQPGKHSCQEGAGQGNLSSACPASYERAIGHSIWPLCCHCASSKGSERGCPLADHETLPGQQLGLGIVGARQTNERAAGYTHTHTDTHTLHAAVRRAPLLPVRLLSVRLSVLPCVYVACACVALNALRLARLNELTCRVCDSAGRLPEAVVCGRGAGREEKEEKKRRGKRERKMYLMRLHCFHSSAALKWRLCVPVSAEQVNELVLECSLHVAASETRKRRTGRMIVLCECE